MSEVHSDDPRKMLEALVADFERQQDCDLFIYAGPIENHLADELPCLQVPHLKHRKNAALILDTFGGSPDGAFKIGRCFQEVYGADSKLTVFVDGYCKSAGTLLACAFDEVVIGTSGELGPLDIQVAKKDELIESNSSLIHSQSLDELEERAFAMFERYFLQMLGRSGGQLRTRSAMAMASEIVVGLMRPLYEQIDPIRLGELSRANSIGVEYAHRLNRGNLKPDAPVKLVATYPSHAFVIDRHEARSLFDRVRPPSELEAKILLGLRPSRSAHLADGEPLWGPVARMLKGTDQDADGLIPEESGSGGDQHAPRAGSSTNGTGQGSEVRADSRVGDGTT